MLQPFSFSVVFTKALGDWVLMLGYITYQFLHQSIINRNIRTSDEINDRYNLDPQQEKLYHGTITAENALENGNNKFGLREMLDDIQEVVDLLQETLGEGSHSYLKQVLEPVQNKCGVTVARSSRPSEEEVKELIRGVKYAINAYDDYDI